MDRSSKVSVLISEILELPPSCLEFVPEKLEEGVEYFVIGTYHLQNEKETENANNSASEPVKQTRGGSLILFRLYCRKL